MGGKNLAIFAVLNHEAGRGPARLRRLFWEQEIAGSNPAAPTTKAAHICGRFFCVLATTCALGLRSRNHPQPMVANKTTLAMTLRVHFFFTQNETFARPSPLRGLNMVSGWQRAHRCRELVFWFRTGEPPPGAAFLWPDLSTIPLDDRQLKVPWSKTKPHAPLVLQIPRADRVVRRIGHHSIGSVHP